MEWSIEQGYDLYPSVEEEINARLDESLDPRGPDQLYDIVGEFGLAAGTKAVDVGCGEGGHTMELARRFGFTVVGVDPGQRNLEEARAKNSDPRVTFVKGSAERLPLDDESADLVWCRDVLVHVRDLHSAYNEMARVLQRSGRALIYQMFATELLEPQECARLERAGFVRERPGQTGDAIAAAGLRIDRVVEIGSEWGEWSQETSGGPARKLLRAARLQRYAAVYIERYGVEVYEMAMADNLWHVYAMIGKLTRRAYVLTRP
jgi:SAM-dependent methyltransferase